MKSITIFTPTYNRGYCLGQLYDSLKRQTCADFCWLIVDDGSTDKTKELVESWVQERQLDIRYYWQENGGKMRAHNYAAKLADTELFLCCDSDDYLVDDAVGKILAAWNNYHLPKDKISGVMGPRIVYKNKVKIENVLPKVLAPMTHYEFSFKKGRVKETFLAFKTSIIRQYPFPVQEGEKFIPEGYVYRQLDEKYKMIIVPDELMVCTYLPDGYTMNNGDYERMRKNPKSLALVSNDSAMRLTWGKKKMVAARDYVVLSLLAGVDFMKIIREAKELPLTLLLFPVALLKYRKINRIIL